MLRVDDAPSLAAEQPVLPVDYANLSIDGRLVVAGPEAITASRSAAIASGDVLLAKEKGIESWHECDVLELTGDLLTLVWSGLPDSEVFMRRIWQTGRLELKPC